MLTTNRKSLIALAVLSAGFVLAVYIVLTFAGATQTWSYPTRYYSQLAEGFLHGRLSLLTPPSPGLLAEPDPYSPAGHNRHDIIFDAVLFNGKYYLYWGPVPALLEAAVCGLCGITHPTLTDRPLAAAFALGIVLLAAILIFQSRKRFFPEQSISTGAAALLSLAMGLPVLFAFENGGVYETAILSGQFFLLTGILAAWLAIRRSAAEAGDKPLFIPAALAGLSWSAAMASRVSLPLAMAAVTVWTAWRLWRRGHVKRRRPTLVAIAALLGTFAIGGGLLGFYNYARFGSFTEFGWHYQLTGQSQIDPTGSGFLSFRNILYNLDAYLTNPPILMHVFPYFYSQNARPWMAGHLPIPRFFLTEPLVGLAWSQPFLLFALFALLGSPRRNEFPTENQSEKVWLIVALCAAVILGMGPALLLAVSTTRYLMDAVPCLGILAAMGYWHFMRRLPPRSDIATEAEAVVWIVAIAQSGLAVLVAISDNLLLLHYFR